MVEQRSLRPISESAVGNLVRFIDSGMLNSRRALAVRRLRELAAREDEFSRLPDDLRQRIREIVAPPLQ